MCDVTSTSTAGSGPPPPPDAVAVAAADPVVTAAFLLGWRLAELYDRDHLPPPSAPSAETAAPPHLPGAGEATDHERAVLLLDQASSALQRLSGVIGDPPVSLDATRAVLDRPDHDRDDVRREIHAFVLAVRTRLGGAEPRLATAFGLGRVLADTVWLPRSKDPALYAACFEHHRLRNAHGWLDDLETAFPARSAAAVRAGLRAWEGWVADVASAGDTAVADFFDEPVIRALHEQGECWRRLLVGEKDPSALLGPADYVAAARALLRRARAITVGFLRAWLLAIVALVVATVVTVAAAVAYAPAGTARAIAVIASLAGALGLSWKGVGASLGSTLTRAEAALWSAEVDAAIGRAATVLPGRVKRRRRLRLGDAESDKTHGATETTSPS